MIGAIDEAKGKAQPVHPVAPNLSRPTTTGTKSDEKLPAEPKPHTKAEAKPKGNSLPPENPVAIPTAKVEHAADIHES
jgi:hypothetical protein